MNGGTPIDRTAIIAQLRAAGCVFAEKEARLLIGAAGQQDGRAERLEALIARRVSGEPLEYVLGWSIFAGLRIAVEPGVFVPRQRSRFLVSTASRLPVPAHPIVVDLCCGSGALGAALAVALPGIELHAADVDPVAAACARRNIEALGGRTYVGDLFGALPDRLRGRIDILLANVPYVPSAAIALMPPEARDHEPRAALDGGTDGLDVLRRVAALAPRWLAPGGHVLFEIGTDQQVPGAAALESVGLHATVRTSRRDEGTVLIGRYAE